MGDGEGEAHQEGLQDLYLLDGFLARGQQVRNVHLGSTKMIGAKAARQKAQKMKVKP
jgi:hypothetical protein